MRVAIATLAAGVALAASSASAQIDAKTKLGLGVDMLQLQLEIAGWLQERRPRLGSASRDASKMDLGLVRAGRLWRDCLERRAGTLRA
jgi:hypothetical protein